MAKLDLERAIILDPMNKEANDLYKTFQIPAIDIVVPKPTFKDPGDLSVLLFGKYDPHVDNVEWAKSWVITIEDEQGNLIKEISGDGNPVFLNKWDGVGDDGKPIGSGKYFASMKVSTDYDYAVYSLKKRFKVIESFPTVLIKKLDGDEDRENEIKVIATVKHPEWIKSSVAVVKDSFGLIVRKMKLESFEGGIIRWNGKDDMGVLVSSGKKYSIQLMGETHSGTDWNSNWLDLGELILFEKNNDRISFQFQNIEFDFGKDEIKPTSVPVLYMVGDILDRYSWYKVVIKGHTDNYGQAEDNLDLSQRRAENVMRFLLMHTSLNAMRASAVGLGESSPLVSNETEDGRQRNRRVEFELIPVDMKQHEFKDISQYPWYKRVWIKLGNFFKGQDQLVSKSD